MSEWQTGTPPNEQWVEVERCVEEGNDFRLEVVEVQAVHGRDGTRPHWRGRDGACWRPEAFSKWRALHGDKPHETLWDHLMEGS